MVDNHWICYHTGKPFEANPDKFGFVYIITNNKNGKKYVGKKQYITAKKWQYYLGSSKYLIADIKKMGIEVQKNHNNAVDPFSKTLKKYFIFEVIAEYKNKRSLGYYEMYYQVKRDVLKATMKGSDEPAYYNNYIGGKFYRPIESYKDPEYLKKLSDSLKGHFVSEETRKKISEKMLGENNPMFGGNFSEEHRKKISNFAKNRMKSKEERNKISNTLKGHPVSEETRKKISEKRKEAHIRHTEETKRNISKAIKLVWKKRKEVKEWKNGNP